MGLKTNKGGLEHIKMAPKIVNICPIADALIYPVRIFQFHMRKLPPKQRSSSLYLRPLRRYTERVWFRDSPTGINTLRSTVKNLCNEAGLERLFMNHSLRATTARRMYNGNCPEQVIQERTGHRSLAVRS